MQLQGTIPIISADIGVNKMLYICECQSPTALLGDFNLVFLSFIPFKSPMTLAAKKVLFAALFVKYIIQQEKFSDGKFNFLRVGGKGKRVKHLTV